MVFSELMESLRVRLATDAASYSGRCATRGLEIPGFGARRLAGEIVSGRRFREADGHGSTERTQTGSGVIALA